MSKSFVFNQLTNGCCAPGCPAGTSINVTFSGLTLCQCPFIVGPDSPQADIISGTVNGAFTLSGPAGGPWTYTATSAITYVKAIPHGGLPCTVNTVSPNTTTADLVISATCSPTGGWRVQMDDIYNTFFGGETSTPTDTTMANLNTSCGAGTGAYGGSATVP